MALPVVGCGGATGSVVGGESHFLEYCDSECGAGLNCISGVCTRSCLLAEASCGDLGQGVMCTDQSIEPGQVAVCDLACEHDVECDGLGDGYQCDTGYCRRDPRASSSISTGGAGGTAGTSSGSGGTSSGGSCEVLFLQFDDGQTGIPNPRGCGTCECSMGNFVCTEEACPSAGQPVFECPPELEEPDGSITSDPIDILAYRVEGNSLVLRVGHSGGCTNHDYGVCYSSTFLETFPVSGRLDLIHDGHGDACEAYLQTVLRFDLTPYANLYNGAYGTNGGIISTNFGSFVFGELECETRSQESELQVAAAIDMVGTECESDDDCVWVEVDAGCSPVPTCSKMAGSGSETLDAAIANIQGSVCQDFEADGCERLPVPRECGGTPELYCDGGQCSAAAR